MARGSLVAVSYPVDGEFVQVNTSVLDGLAEVAFLDGRPDAEFRDILRQADVLIGWHLSQELPAGILEASPDLRLVQLLSAGADSVDFAAIPERLVLASNVGAYAEPMAEYVMAMALALARRLPQRQGLGPELRDVDTAHEAHAVLAQRVLDEVPDRGGPPGLPAPAGVDANRHQPRAVAVPRLVEQVVEAELEALEEVPGHGVGRGDQVPDVVVHLAVRHHQERRAQSVGVVRKLVVVGVGVVQEAAVLDQQFPGVDGGRRSCRQGRSG
jgi:D-isomer specific 2-hydroxyacid dehydrogenase, catalytic domain